MAKLTEVALEEGRDFIRAKNLDGFMKWIDNNNIVISRVVVKDTYSRLFKLGDTEKALKMFEKVFPGMDPTADIVGGLAHIGFKVGCAVLLGLGALGGLVYLIKVIL
ncbi:MAG: hypothetical protein ACXABY_17770 [Candidatus Thorarchaeota archaeon]|jgi:hypothetical protein